MPDWMIRQIHGEELLTTIHPIWMYCFDVFPSSYTRDELLDDAKKRQNRVNLCLFEGGEAVSAVSGIRMTQNVRGKIFPSMGVGGVASMPQARRKGYVRQLMRELLHQFRELDDGYPISSLYPFQERFYARCGYAPTRQDKVANFTPRDVRHVRHLDLDGEIRLTDNKTSYGAYREWLHSFQQTQHGMTLFQTESPSFVQEDRHFTIATAWVDDELVGMMTYQLKDDGKPVLVPVFLYHDLRGRYLLLDWIARHEDQVKEFRLHLAASEHPENWCLDVTPEMSTYHEGEATGMVRVLDVTGLDGMQVGTGQVLVQITDELCPWNEGVYCLANVDGVLDVAPVDSSEPHGALSIQGLSALVFGTLQPEELPYFGWGSLSDFAADQLRSLFPPMLPYLLEQF